MKQFNFKKILVGPDISIKQALKRMDHGGRRVLFVATKNNKLLGALSDGDLRRALLQGCTLEDSIKGHYNARPVFLEESAKGEAQRIFKEKSITAIPIVDTKKIMIECLFLDEIFEEAIEDKKCLDIPVVIMAGGKGTRLDPFTRILPKPLIPVGHKAFVEVIMDHFKKEGISDFYLIVNYKGEMIKSYFDNIDVDYNIRYIWEKKFLDTAGGLKLLPQSFKDTFMVSNCDNLITMDYADALSFHKKNKNYLTIIGAFHHYKVPYGIILYEKHGKVTTIKEKPEYDMVINTGIYIVDKQVLKFIPKDRRFSMVDLINILLKKELPVGVFPVSEKSYVDIGQWDEYNKNLKQLTCR